MLTINFLKIRSIHYLYVRKKSECNWTSLILLIRNGAFRKKPLQSNVHSFFINYSETQKPHNRILQPASRNLTKCLRPSKGAQKSLSDLCNHWILGSACKQLAPAPTIKYSSLLWSFFYLLWSFFYSFLVDMHAKKFYFIQKKGYRKFSFGCIGKGLPFQLIQFILGF